MLSIPIAICKRNDIFPKKIYVYTPNRIDMKTT